MSSPDPTLPSQGVPYSLYCTGYGPCREGENVAAVYDYVGAVYGEDGAVKRDGVLLPEERSYVERTFGRILARKEVEGFVAHARKVFLGRKGFPVPLHCEKDSTSAQTHRHRKYGEALALGGAHGCADNYSNAYLTAGMELRAASFPNKVVFFLEGWDRLRSRGLPELVLFSRIAAALNAPVKEGLVGQNDEKVIQRAGLTRMEAAVAVFNFVVTEQIILARQKGEPLDLLQLQADFIKDVSEFFAVPATELIFASKEFSTPLAGEGLREAYFRTKTIAGDRFARLLRSSNELTPDHIRNELKQGQYRFAVFVLGKHHLSYVRRIYEGK